jgi:HD-GYP domain-containing protein (c-di-GMP phosphodiesterase class II)
MAEKETIIPLTKILSSQNEKSINKNYIDIIQEEEIPVLCINNDTHKERQMPFKVLYDNHDTFWHQSGNWKYYLSEEGFNKLKEKAIVKPGAWDMEKPKLEVKTEEKPEDDDIEELEVEVGFGSEYQTFAKMSIKEKVEYLNRNKNRLSELLTKKIKDETEIVDALVDTTKDTTLINHAVLEDALRLADDEAKKFTQSMVDSTHEMVKSAAQLITENNILSNELVKNLEKKSNGTIIQHMTRVFNNGMRFLSFYNKLVSTSSIIQKLRISFAATYRKFYHHLLPHMNIDDIMLERVFYGGMRAIPPDQYHKWAVGFFLHDIGKADAVEYHEGEASYNRNIVIDHVKQGYLSIMNKTNYPKEVALITGYHHEYYGDPNGYGYFRVYLEQYKKANPNAKQDFCVTYDLEPFIDFHALAYFPAKILEIVDVYDSVTDPHRVYRKPLTPAEALAMMREEFIEKHHKLDAILFDIFTMYIHETEM